MTTSEQIDAIAAALAKAQAEMGKAKKGSENPHFRSKYADLASVSDACLPALHKQDIAVVQCPSLLTGEEGLMACVETTLLHKSGQYLRDICNVPVTKADAHGTGSAYTYGRRYALAAMCGIAPEDDDGNAAVGDGKPAAKEVISEGTRTDAPNDGKLYVVQMNSKTKGDKTTYSVHFSDGESFLTKSDFMASLAEQMRANGTPCQRQTSRTYLNGLTSDDTDDIDAAMPTRTADEEPPI